MAKYQNQIEYSITTKLDSKGLTQLQSQIREVEASLNRMANGRGKIDEVFNFSDSAKQLQELNRALSSSFNSSLGMLDISRFKTELKDAGVTAQSLGKAFADGGTQGKIAFNNLLGQLGKVDTGLKRSSSAVDKMFNTISNTVRWGIVSSGFSAMLNSLHQSVDYVKELDNSLTQIMLVTDYSREQMNEYAKSANEAAKALGATTVDVTKGSQVFAQQGFNLQQSSQLAELSIKLANASEQDSATTSDQITAIMNAYDLSGSTDQLKQALDSWALVANISAADVEELAKASQKAASSASVVGVSLDQMNAQIGTIESVTRDAPEQIGNGLKTLYSRLSDISLGETLEDGVDLGKVTGTLDKIGVQVLDQAGQMRNVGDILEDLMVVWDDLDQTSKEAAGQAIAGKYQLNRFYALMDNSDMYNQYKEGSIGASGTLDQMNAEYLNSMAGKSATLQATLEGLFNSIFDPDNFYPAIDALTSFINLIKELTDSLGGGQTILTGVIALFGRLFSKNIAQSINDIGLNIEMDKMREQNAIASRELLNELVNANPELMDQNSLNNVNFSNFLQENQNRLSKEALNQGNQIFEDNINATNRWNQALQEAEETAQQIQFILGNEFKDPMKIFTDENGIRSITPVLEDLQKAKQKFNLNDLKQNTRESLEELQAGFKEIAEGSQNEIDINKIKDRAFEASQALKVLGSSLPTDEYEKFQTILEWVQEGLKQTDLNTEDLDITMKDATNTVQKMMMALEKMTKDDVDSYIKKMGNKTSNALIAQGDLEAQQRMQKGFQENASKQFNIQNIVDTISVMGQLTFAAQSFINLGSIWQNQDLSDGEKLLQTLMNLSMVIPSIISSIKELKQIGVLSSLKNIFTGGGIRDAKEQIEKAKESLKELEKEKEIADQKVESALGRYETNKKNSAVGKAKDMSKPNAGLIDSALDNQANAYKKVQAAEEGVTSATKGLTAAQIDLAAGIAAVVAAIIITIIDAYGNSLEATRDKAKSLAEESASAAEQTKESVSNWQSLYDKYKETGEVSDELVKSSEELSKSLGVVSGDALIAAENFDSLKKSIEDAANTKYDKAVNDSMAAISAEQAVYDNNPFSTLPFIGSESVMSELKNTAGEVRSILNPNEFKLGYNPGDKGSPIGMIDGMLESIDRLKEAQDKVNRSTEEGEAAWQRYQKAIDATNRGLHEESAAAVTKEAENAFNNRIQNTKFQEEVKNLGTDVDAIIQKFQTDEATSGWFKLSKDGAEQLGLALRSVTDDAQKMALSVAQADASFSEQMSKKASGILQNAVNEGQISFRDLNVKDANEYGEQYTKYYQEQIQNSGLTDKEKLEFIASIDWNGSLDEISKQIEEINNHKMELPKLEFEPTLTDRSDFTQDETDSLLKDTKMSESSLNRMSADIFSDSEIGNEANRIESELQNLYDTIGEGNEPTDEQTEKIKDLRQEYENLGETSKDIATYNLQMNKGVSNLVKNWKNYADVLSDDAAKGTSDYYQTLGELDKIMSDILNIDVGVLSSGFYENEDAINAMARAAEGDVSAIDELRQIAAEDIIMHLDVQGISPEDKDYLINQELLPMLSEFQGLLDGAPLGMTVDAQTDPFLQKLNQLLADSQITAEQASNILSSIGMDATITQVSEPQTHTVTQHFPRFRIDTVEKEGMKVPMLVPDGTEEISYQETSDLSFPQIKGATYTGAGIQTVGAGSSGNAPHKSGGGGGSCFVANTLIAMHGFYKKIQEITKGDIVLSYNETTKTNEYSQVVQTMIHSTTEEIYTLSIKDEQLRVTGIHRFFIKRNNSINWIEASNLKVGDLVFLANGTWSKILNISINIETRYVYNFEVSNNHNYYVGTNRILAHNKGGGGGGGGSGKTYEPKTKEPIEEEIDLYEKVNTQLDDVEETLKGIQQETDRLIGARGRANMNKQIKLLQKEIDLQREKLKIQEKERNDLGKQLSSNFGVTFDSEGFISNYAATLKRLEKAHNDLVNQYNATGTEEGQEALEKQIEKAKENIDKFKDLYKRYDELQGKEIKDTINQIEELDDSIEDLRIDAYKAAQEAIDDLKEIRDNGAELLGLFTDYKSDSPFRATIVDAEKLKNIFGGTKKDVMQYYDTLIRKNQELAKTAKTTEDRLAAESAVAFFQGQKLAANNNPLGTGALGLASQDLQRLQYWVNNPNAGDNPFGKNTAALYEAYEDAYNRMRELAMESEEAWEQLEEDIIDGYDDIAEREEEQIDRYDRLTERLENIADMRALVYGEEEFGNIARIYDQIGRSTLQQAKDQKMIYEQWVARYEAIEDKTSDIAKEVRTHMEEAEDKLIEIQKEVAEAWQEAFENALKEITAQTNKNLFGARNLDDTQSDWERDKEFSERYYDNVQKVARIDQLRAKYLSLLDDAQGSSLDIQRRIRDAMNEQVKYLEDQKYLSEYNVKYANAQLEILQKQIALEDARNNKNQMRLRRDTQGNYRYVYSADQNDVRDKEQDLLQSQMDAYDMSKQNRLDTTQEAFNLYRTTMEQLEALNQRIRQGDEEAVKAKEQLLEDFERDMKAYSEEIGDSWNGMVESLKWMAETGTDTVKDTVEAALTAIEEKNDEALTNMGVKGNETIVNAISDVESLLGAVTNANNDMTTQAETYRNLINDEVAPLVKQGYDDIDGAIQNASESTRDLAAATRELNEALTGDNAQLVEATQQLENYRKQLDDVKNSSAVTAQQLRKAQQELDQSKAQNLNYKTILDDIAAGRRDKNGNLPTPKTSGGSSDRSIKEGRKVKILSSYAEYSGGPYISNPLYGPGSIMYIQNVPGWGVGPINGMVHVGTETRFGWDTQVGWIRPQDLQFLNTGGYTGDWDGSEGKIAMLHQKELVLNATDTENILQAVNMVRNMVEMLKTFSGVSVKGTGFNKLGGDTIEQRVEITAEFPNVQDSKEIENALLNIADSAYQYSYRTR